MTEKPVIYLIDDEPQTGAVAELRRLGVEADFLYPTEVTEQHLLTATLLAVDEVFDLRKPTDNEDWDLPPGLPIAVVPPDGLALAAVLRSASTKLGGRAAGPLGITMRTSRLHEIAFGVPHGVRQPFVAAQYDLEWAVAKENEDNLEPISQLVSLAKALHTYPRDWDSATQETGLTWIGVPDQPWAAAARRQVLACRPPANTTSKNRHHLAWLRWLAQRALPFPTFLISDVYAATSLGVTVESFRAASIDPDSGFGAALQLVTYSGPLEDLERRRYWRAGIRHLAEQAVDDELDADDPAEVAAALVETYSNLEPLGLVDPVVAINEDYYASETPIERASAVRLAPDGWPAYADPAWTSEQDADDPSMARLLAPRLS